MDRRPTIKDVAKEAGVSKSTVSLVLQRSPLVKDETRALVRDAMARIGYVYNRSAAQLRGSSSGLIGLIINDLRNPFFTEFATSFQTSLAARGYAVVLAHVNEDAVEQGRMIDTLIEHGVSGFVVSPAYSDEPTPLEAIARAGLPAIQVFRKVDAREELFPFIAPNYETGSRAATEHLFERGATHVAFVGGLAGRAVTEERMSGYLAVMAEKGLEPLVLTGAATHAFGLDTSTRLQTECPSVDGALCFNDQVALGLMAGASAQGRRIGHDMRVIGFDNIEGSRQSVPALTSVACGIPQFATDVAARLLAWLDDGVVPESGMRTDVSLIIRGSS